MIPQAGRQAQALRALLILPLLALSACDGARTGRSKGRASSTASDEPTAPECKHVLDGNEGLVLLPGVYRAGDDLLDEVLEIRVDGTYFFDDRGCGFRERGRDRLWRQRGSKVVFMQGLELMDEYREGELLTVEGQLVVHVESRSRGCMLLTRAPTVEAGGEAESLSEQRDLGE